MDAFYAYNYGTAGWLGLQGLTLLATPKLIISMLQDEPTSTSLLEIYFARSFGISLLAISMLSLILTGSISLTSTPTVTSEEADPKAPFAVPSLLATAAFHAASAFYTYSWFMSNGLSAFGAGMAGYALLASAGLWCLLFGGDGGRISKKTGADKRTSGFPFGNKEAAKRKGKAT